MEFIGCLKQMSMRKVYVKNLWDLAMGIPRGKFVVLNALIRE